MAGLDYLSNAPDDLQPEETEEQQRLRLLNAGPPGGRAAWWKPPTDIPAPHPIEDAVAPESDVPDAPAMPAVAAAPVQSAPPGIAPVDANVQQANTRLQQVFGNKPQPKEPKWWQRALAGAAGFGAGYYNAEGKAGHIDPTAAEDVALGGPGNRRRLADWQHNVETAQLGAQGAAGEREAWFKKNKEEADQRLQTAQAEHLGAQTDQAKATAEATRAGTKDRYLRVGDGVFDKKLGKWTEQPTSKVGTMVVDSGWAKQNLPMLIPDEAGQFRVPAAGLTQILSNATKPDPAAKENEQVWIATLNDPASTPQQKQTARANLDEALKQKKAGAAAPPDKGQNFIDPATGRMVRIEPGGAVPKGAMTASGLNTVNTPTSQSRGMSEMANTVIAQVPTLLGQIDALKDKIGPAAGRWNELWVKKAGLNDPDFAGLDQDLDLFASALVRTHFGGRGGQGYREALKKDFSMAQSPEDLKSRIQHAETWLQGYANIANKGGGVAPAAAQQTPTANTPKIGETQQHQGATYKFDGKQWVRQ